MLLASYAHSYDMVLLVFPAIVLYAERLHSRVNHPWSTMALYALYVSPAIVVLIRQHAMVPAMLLAIVVLWKGTDLSLVRAVATAGSDSDQALPLEQSPA
jgi:hypothetical protein